MINAIQYERARVIYINGIFNSKQNASNTCTKILEPEAKIKVDYIWNSTRLDGIFFNDERTSAKYAIEELKNYLVEHIFEKRKICIIAHSKGCHIALQALEKLESSYGSDLRTYVRVYGFGGITLIPKRLGVEVHNYTAVGQDLLGKTTDLIAETGGEYYKGFSENFVTWRTIRVKPNLAEDYDTREIFTKNHYDYHSFQHVYSAKAIEKIKEFKEMVEASEKTMKDVKALARSLSGSCKKIAVFVLVAFFGYYLLESRKV
ncbi:MAG: alpha/beta hydrolase [Chlamydiae bacterium]|nr:alpha/beta hydrolase [Chlamydiota bacterium]